MSKFDFMNFEGGEDTEFVVHAEKFTKEEAIEKCLFENDWRFEEANARYRKPVLSDIAEDRVKYFVKIPEYCGLDSSGGGCYTYCDQKARGSFPVWVIEFQNLRI